MASAKIETGSKWKWNCHGLRMGKKSLGPLFNDLFGSIWGLTDLFGIKAWGVVVRQSSPSRAQKRRGSAKAPSSAAASFPSVLFMGIISATKLLEPWRREAGQPVWRSFLGLIWFGLMMYEHPTRFLKAIPFTLQLQKIYMINHYHYFMYPWLLVRLRLLLTALGQKVGPSRQDGTDQQKPTTDPRCITFVPKTGNYLNYLNTLMTLVTLVEVHHTLFVWHTEYTVSAPGGPAGAACRATPQQWRTNRRSSRNRRTRHKGYRSPCLIWRSKGQEKSNKST